MTKRDVEKKNEEQMKIRLAKGKEILAAGREKIDTRRM